MNIQLKTPPTTLTATPTLQHLHFSLPLRPWQIEHFRGAIAQLAGLGSDHFHNHDNARGNYHYRYPLIHYQVVEGCAAITALGEGVEALERVLEGYDGRLWMGGRWHRAEVERITAAPLEFGVTPTWHTYHLRDWIALTDHSYRQWRSFTRMADKLALLERAFVGQVLAFAGGIGWHVDQRLVAEVVRVDGQRLVPCRGMAFMAFDATVRVQALLPTGIGLGKAVSLGFGRVKSEK